MSKSRLCHIQKWENFDGYGFNLHAEKGKPGQYIGKVDEGSPAEAAGLRQGDRILEVNGESIANKTHKQVVELIKAQNGETRLLVVDPDEEEVDGEGNGKDNGNGDVISTEINNKNSSNDEKTTTTMTTTKKEENGQLNLSMTAAELRAKLAAKKKFDPKKEAMDFKKKFDIVQKL